MQIEEQGFVVRNMLDVYAVLGLAVSLILTLLAWAVAAGVRLVLRRWRGSAVGGKRKAAWDRQALQLQES